jgi:hypothetical protein
MERLWLALEGNGLPDRQGDGADSDRALVATVLGLRDVPWNGPYYETLGNRELSGSEIGREVSAEMKLEASLPGIDASRRCAMIRPNGGASWARLQLDLDNLDDTAGHETPSHPFRSLQRIPLHSDVPPP